MLAHAVFVKIAVFTLFGIQNGKVGLTSNIVNDGNLLCFFILIAALILNASYPELFTN
jgi:hypothetical protein